MPILSLTTEGLKVDGKPFSLPCTRARLVEVFGKPGPEDRNLYGIQWPFPSAAVIALENLNAPDPSNPIVQVTLRPAEASGFTVEGLPWDKVKFRKTEYGPEKRLGGWVISNNGDTWALYPQARPAAKAGPRKLLAAKANRSKKPLDLSYPKVPSKSVVELVDPNFKLLVLEHLMFEAKVLEPAFRLEGFVAAWKERDIDLTKEGYDEPIAEVAAWFAAYPIDRKHLKKVRSLAQHPGTVLHGVFPHWTGEDDTFAITSAEDAKHLPSLEEIRLFSRSPRRDGKLARDFAVSGVTATF